jgi:signal transduction histidine kinase
VFQQLRMSLAAAEQSTGSDNGANEAATAGTPLVSMTARATRGTLFRKYLLLFMALVSTTLLANTAIDLWFTYRENEEQLARLQLEKANSATQRIEQFFTEVENQIGWTTYVQWSAGTLDQRRSDYFRLLRQVPAITELSELDSNGKEQLKVSRLAINVVGSETDFSKDPRFTEALANKLWFSPVHLVGGSEPYLNLAIARAGRNAGVTVAAVNLKFIWGVISSVRIGENGYAYVVDREGRLIAHPNASLVLKNTNLGRLSYIADALRTAAEGNVVPAVATVQNDFNGRRVLTAHTVVPALGWLVFVELPLSEALAPTYRSALRGFFVLLAGLVLASFAAMFLVRRMVGPIRMLQAGAAQIGAGDLDSRITVRTGDELEALADQFNTMAAQLQEYNAGLERTVEQRTQDLARSVRELQALSDVVHAVNSTLDLHVLLTSIVTHATELASADAGAIFRLNDVEQTFELVEASNMASPLVNELRSFHITSHETAMGEAARTQKPVQLADMAMGPTYPLREAIVAAGFRVALIVPLIVPDATLGALVLVRRAVGDFAPSVVELTSTFASQSALAMQNAALFQQLAEKSRQLQLASEHKTQFLANMSHELRTPLNAILGFTELLVDGIYGELPDKPRGVLDRVQENGRNLLALINDVLDLAKIEAGQLELRLEAYQIAPLVRNVVDAMQPLARSKGLSLVATVAGDVPAAYGDVHRLRQVLVNLVGNAIKFTDVGEVEISVAASGGRLDVAVRDTGPGIAPEDQEKIFEEFQQLDNSSTRRQGGTGLGLAISRRIMQMHGGYLSVVSAPGRGSTFHIDIPVRFQTETQGVA